MNNMTIDIANMVLYLASDKADFQYCPQTPYPRAGCSEFKERTPWGLTLHATRFGAERPPCDA